MSNKSLDSLRNLGDAAQLINDFKIAKKEYFELKRQHSLLIQKNHESVDEDYWEDENFESEIKIFDQRIQKYDEAQELYKKLKSKLDNKS